MLSFRNVLDNSSVRHICDNSQDIKNFRSYFRIIYKNVQFWNFRSRELRIFTDVNQVVGVNFK